MNAYLWILVWTFILFTVCEVLQYQEWKELEKKYFEEKRKADKYFNSNVKLCEKIANVRTELNQIEKQLEIKEQECLEANRRINDLKEGGLIMKNIELCCAISNYYVDTGCIGNENTLELVRSELMYQFGKALNDGTIKIEINKTSHVHKFSVNLFVE